MVGGTTNVEVVAVVVSVRKERKKVGVWICTLSAHTFLAVPHNLHLMQPKLETGAGAEPSGQDGVLTAFLRTSQMGFSNHKTWVKITEGSAAASHQPSSAVLPLVLGNWDCPGFQ